MWYRSYHTLNIQTDTSGVGDDQKTIKSLSQDNYEENWGAPEISRDWRRN